MKKETIKELKMIFRLFRAYKTGKTVYDKILKPVYEELRKDAYALDEQEKSTNKKRGTVKKNAVNKKPKRSRRGKTNT